MLKLDNVDTIPFSKFVPEVVVPSFKVSIVLLKIITVLLLILYAHLFVFLIDSSFSVTLILAFSRVNFIVLALLEAAVFGEYISRGDEVSFVFAV